MSKTTITSCPHHRKRCEEVVEYPISDTSSNEDEVVIPRPVKSKKLQQQQPQPLQQPQIQQQPTDAADNDEGVYDRGGRRRSRRRSGRGRSRSHRRRRSRSRRRR